MTPQALDTRCGALRATLLREPLARGAHGGAEPRISSAGGRGCAWRCAVRPSARTHTTPHSPDSSGLGARRGLTPPRLEHAVRQVWASAYGARVLRYGQHRRLRPASMAVIVQEQVDAVVLGRALHTRPVAATGRPPVDRVLCRARRSALSRARLTPAPCTHRARGLAHRGRAGGRRRPLELRPAPRWPRWPALARHALALERSARPCTGHRVERRPRRLR